MDGELMELSSGIRSIEQLPLPPGFRFAPTDEELVWHYLKRQSDSGSFEFRVIAEVELYKFNPWDLPEKALFGEKEWYFFSPRDRKYPRGVRPNRAAASGYWKATGTDKPIYLSSVSGHRRHVGMKKSLVFYHGRAPASPESKTNWMMHEYRLADSEKPSTQLHRRGSQRLDGWVLCKVYMKPSSLAQRAASHEHEMESVFPALPEFGEQLQTDSATQEEDCVTTTSEATTFSTMMLNMSGAISSMVPSRQQTIASPSAWNLQHSIASNSQQARLTQELGAPLGQQTGPALSCNYLHLPQLQFHPQWPSSSFTTPGHYNARIESTAGQISTSDEVEEVQSPLQYYASNFEGALFTGDDQTPADDLSTYPMPPGMGSFSYGPSSGSL